MVISQAPKLDLGDKVQKALSGLFRKVVKFQDVITFNPEKLDYTREQLTDVHRDTIVVRDSTIIVSSEMESEMEGMSEQERQV